MHVYFLIYNYDFFMLNNVLEKSTCLFIFKNPTTMNEEPSDNQLHI